MMMVMPWQEIKRDSHQFKPMCVMVFSVSLYYGCYEVLTCRDGLPWSLPIPLKKIKRPNATWSAPESLPLTSTRPLNTFPQTSQLPQPTVPHSKPHHPKQFNYVSSLMFLSKNFFQETDNFVLHECQEPWFAVFLLPTCAAPHFIITSTAVLCCNDSR